MHRPIHQYSSMPLTPKATSGANKSDVMNGRSMQSLRTALQGDIWLFLLRPNNRGWLHHMAIPGKSVAINPVVMYTHGHGKLL